MIPFMCVCCVYIMMSAETQLKIRQNQNADLITIVLSYNSLTP